jgi:cation diffusion facilitator family transporter
MAHGGSTRVVMTALAGNAAIAITKLAAALFTGSAAMFSEAIHSAVDTGNQVLLLLGLKRAARPASAGHQFGHGLELYFWAFVVAILIFGAGAVVSINHGIHRIAHPAPIENVWVNYVVLGLSMLFEGAAWRVAWKEFDRQREGRSVLRELRSSKDPAVFTVLFEDSAAMLGLIIALVGIFLSQTLHMPMIDGIASIGVGVVLAITAAFLALESHSLLTGESVYPEVRADIVRLATGEPEVERLNQALTMHFGPHDVLCALSLDFRDDVTAGEVEGAVTRIERAIKAAHPEVTRVFVEAQSFAADRRGGSPAAAEADA